MKIQGMQQPAKPLAWGRIPFWQDRIRWLEVGLLAVLLVFPAIIAVIVGDESQQKFQLALATKILLFAILALTLDTVWGYAGIFDLGHAVFFGISAYIAGLLAVKLKVTSGFVAIPAAILAATILSFLFGLFLFGGRRRLGDLFVAMATLALAYICQRTAANWYDIGAANGIPSVPFMTFGLPGLPGAFEAQPGLGFYYVVGALTVLAYLGFRYLIRSQFGLVLIAARANEQRVSFLGYDTSRFKLTVYTLSGTVSGLIGCLYTFHEGYVGPTMLGIDLSTQLIIWVLVGGSGTLIGAVGGALVMNYASFKLSEVEFLMTLWQIVLGAVLVVVVVLLPKGLVSLIQPRRRTDRPRPGDPAAPAVARETAAAGETAAREAIR